MSTRQHSALLLLGASVATLVALTGCSGAGTSAKSAPTESAPAKSAPADSSSAQSKASACLALEQSLSSSTDALKTSFGELGTDPTKAIAGLNTFADAFDGGIAKVDNEPVGKAAAKADASLKAMIAEVQSSLNDPSKGTTNLQAAVKTFQTDFTGIATLCK